MATGKGNVVNTTRGLQLITKLVSAQTKLTFTNVKIGTGSPQEGVDPSELTHLVAYKMDGQIAEYGYDDGAGEAYVVMQLTNTSIVTGFVMTEIGLYAQDPDLGEILYAYVDLSDDPNYIMPPENGRSKTIQIKLHTIVGEVANITATINPLAQVTRAEFERELANKVDSIGGDTADTLVSAFDASSDSFPVPAAKEKARTRWGKMKKFTEDFRNWMTGVCLIGQIVNNCVTDRTDLPLSAAQGKVLMDLYTVLNTKLINKSITATYDIPDRDGVSTDSDYISIGFHNITQYSNGQCIYSIQAFVYPTSLIDCVIGKIPAEYMHIRQDVYSYCYDMTGSRFLLIRITPQGNVRLETLDGSAIPQAEVRMRGSIVF